MIYELLKTWGLPVEPGARVLTGGILDQLWPGRAGDRQAFSCPPPPPTCIQVPLPLVHSEHSPLSGNESVFLFFFNIYFLILFY